MSRVSKIFSFVILFLMSFIFFTYLVFPYEVLKEVMSREVSNMTGLNLRIEKLEPKILGLGFNLENVVMKDGGSSDVKFDSVEVSVGILPLLWGSVSTNLEAKVGKADFLKIYAGFNLIGLVIRQEYVPRSLEVSSKKFPVGKFVNFFIRKQANEMEVSSTIDPVMKAMLPPLLKDIELVAELFSEVDMDLDVDNLEKSKGTFSIELKNAVFNVNDPGLGIPKQSFSKALVKASIANGQFKFAPESGIQSSDLIVEYGGQISLKSRIDRSPMDIKAKVKLSGPLKEQFGVVLGLVGAQKEDEVSLEVTGTLVNPDIRTF